MSEDSKNKDWIFQVESLFCLFFTIELLIRFFAFKNAKLCFQDNWFRFDFILVIIMIFETWLLTLYTTWFQTGNTDVASDSSGGTDLLPLARLLRLLRLARMARLMRAFPELLTLLRGIWAATKSVTLTLLLLIFFLYIFAVIFKIQLKGVADAEEMYGTVLQCMWTLLLAGTFMDEVAYVLAPVREDSWVLAFVFLLYMILTACMVLNILIGVLCEVVREVAQAEAEKVAVSFIKARLMGVLEEQDKDKSGSISKAEFYSLMQDPRVNSALADLGVDVPNLISLADVLFDNELIFSSGEVEVTHEEHELSFQDFLETILRLRADNVASVTDIVDLRKFVREFLHKMRDSFWSLDKALGEALPTLPPPEGGGKRKTDTEMAANTNSWAIRSIGVPRMRDTANIRAAGNKVMLKQCKELDTQMSRIEKKFDRIINGEAMVLLREMKDPTSQEKGMK